MTAAAALLTTRPAALCPRDGAPVDGGPVAYLCPVCGRGVMAADVRAGSAVAAPTHVLTARGTGGKRANPLVYASPTFRFAYCEADVAARLALAARDGVEVDVMPARAELLHHSPPSSLPPPVARSHPRPLPPPRNPILPPVLP